MTKKIFTIGDIQGEVPIAESFSFLLQKENPDLLLINGDISDFTSFDPLGLAEKVLDNLEMGNVKIYAVPGNHDSKKIRDAISIYGMNIHERYKVYNNTAIIGFGGAQTPFDTPFEPSEEDMEENIVRDYNEVKDRDDVEEVIFLCHDPPYNTKLDEVENGDHVGSKKLRELIEKLKPDVVICGHIHESPGIDKIEDTTIINPGPFFRRNYGIIEINDDGNIEAEISGF